MGKSRRTKIKRLGDEILEHHSEHFTTNFEDNKKMIAEVAVIPSKTIRNQVAGYITQTLNQRVNGKQRTRAWRPPRASTR